MEDVLSVYKLPYDPQRPVVCFDEARKEFRSTPHGSLLPTSGQPLRQDYEYERHGSASMFLWVEPLAGRRGVTVTGRQTGHECAGILRHLVEECYPDVELIRLVCDNLKTHGAACLYARYPPEVARRIAEKLEFHYTPEHASWLNMAECELSALHRQCLDRRIKDTEMLQQEVAVWERHRNQTEVTIDWRFTTEDARIKLKRLYPVLKEQQST
jgi:hypothetical protein